MNLLFDLDGTLTDPLVGIGRSLQHAMARMGREPPALEALARYVGPPLRDTLAELLGSDDPAMVERAVRHYRERFGDVGLFENTVYAGVPDAVAALAARGHRLLVATSKPTIYARRIVERFGFGRWFQGVHGSELDGRNVDKVDLIRVVLKAEGLEAGATWMIGDRAPDVRGGRANATRTAGVLWGYGSETELRAAEPDALLRTPADLAALDG
jgi:phosphoglycolate phosphatase